MPLRKLESDAERCCGRGRRHSGGFLLRIMPPSWHPVPACAPRLCCRRAVLLAGTIALHRFSISSPNLRIDAARRSKQGQSVHRFSISGLDLRIDAAIRSKQGQSLHRFLISSPNLRIDAAIRSKQGQTVHRFLISSPDLRIDAAKRPKQGNPSSPREDCIVPRPGNAGWAGTSDGVAARGFVKEGPAAQRWEGKHRRCAPVRSPCPQADSDAGTRPCPQAARPRLTTQKVPTHS